MQRRGCWERGAMEKRCILQNQVDNTTLTPAYVRSEGALLELLLGLKTISIDLWFLDVLNDRNMQLGFLNRVEPIFPKIQGIVLISRSCFLKQVVWQLYRKISSCLHLHPCSATTARCDDGAQYK